jgi:hypothetical protein
LPLERRTIPAVRIMDEKSDFVFSEWANSPDKTRY